MKRNHWKHVEQTELATISFGLKSKLEGTSIIHSPITELENMKGHMKQVDAFHDEVWAVDDEDKIYNRRCHISEGTNDYYEDAYYDFEIEMTGAQS